MGATEFNLVLPDWYRIERETEKTVNRLESVKELDYYLSNSDEYVRRLAIIRLQKISAKESAYVLKEILDDPVETSENKYIAAWALYSILRKKDSDLFISSKYLGKFTGNERYEDLFPVISEESCSSVRFDFTSSEIFASLKLDKEDTALERDVFFETSFDFKQWSSIFSSNLIKSAIAGLRAVGPSVAFIPILIGKGFSNLFRKLSQARLKRNETESRKPGTPDYELPIFKEVPSDYTGLRSKLYRKTVFLSLAKKGGFQMLYFLFSPLRFIRRHKLAILCILLAAYMLLAYTEYGRAFTNKYIAFDMRNIPNIALQKAREYSTTVLTGLNKLTGLDEYRKGDGLKASEDVVEISDDRIEKAAADGKLYLITAKKGLNMRMSPDPKSEKVGSGPLPYGSTVIYLSKSENDASGSVWYYVEARDGRSGWVSARYLKEGKEG